MKTKTLLLGLVLGVLFFPVVVYDGQHASFLVALVLYVCLCYLKPWIGVWVLVFLLCSVPNRIIIVSQASVHPFTWLEAAVIGLIIAGILRLRGMVIGRSLVCLVIVLGFIFVQAILQSQVDESLSKVILFSARILIEGLLLLWIVTKLALIQRPEFRKLLYSLPFALLPGVLMVLVVSFSTPSVVQYLGIDWILQGSQYGVRGLSPIGGPNTTGGVLIVAIIMAFSLYMSTRCRRSKILVFAFILVSCTALIATYSRGSVFGLMCAASVWGWVVLLSRFKRKRSVIVISAIMVICGMLLSLPEVGRLSVTGFSVSSPLSWDRLPYWELAFELFLDRPIFGWGYSALLHPEIVTQDGSLNLFHSHNVFLETLYSFGLVGSLGIAWYLFPIMARHLTRIRHSLSSATLVAATIGLLAHGIYDFIWWEPRAVYLLAIMFGLLIPNCLMEEFNENCNSM